MLVRDYLEKGRSLAERIPYSFIALAFRIAVADVFWRSGQTKVNGFSIREEILSVPRGVQSTAAPAGSGGLSQHHRRARFSDPAVRRACLAVVRTWAIRHDDGDPAVRGAGRLARTHPVALAADADHRPRPRRDLARSSDLERSRPGAGVRPRLIFRSQQKPSDQRSAAFRCRCTSAIGSREQR